MHFLVLVLAFLCGALPFGVWIGRSQNVDVRKVGSGNVGATNVWRALGPRWGSLAFALDVVKGTAGPVLALYLLPGQPTWVALCGISAVLGHIFSPFLGFRGGKGISTGLGALLGMMPLVGLFLFLFWGMVLLATRMVSAASIAACLMLPLLGWGLGVPTVHLTVACLMSGFALFKHIPNMKRILNGTEPRLGQRANKTPLDGSQNLAGPGEAHRTA